MPDMVSFQRNAFQSSVNASFKTLRDDLDFIDVTLVCDDGQKMGAHQVRTPNNVYYGLFKKCLLLKTKVILATESTFFRKLLLANKHGHPLIHMRGLTSVDLAAILDFLYSGEATISRTNLGAFLILAEQLQLEGLVTEEAKKNAIDSEEMFERNLDEITTEMFDRKPIETTRQFSAEANFKSSFSADSKGLSEMVKSMMEKSGKTISRNIRGKLREEKANVCNVCGKEGPYTTITDHIEANHIEGICLPCNFCDTTCTSRLSLRWHKRKYHSNGNISQSPI